MRAHIICRPVFVRRGIISVVRCFYEKTGWNDIQSSDIKHQGPVELWCIDRLQEQRAAMVKGMEIVEERDRWSRQKTSRSAANSVWGPEALGFMSVRIWRKSCSPERKSGERKRETCKGMCGPLRVWMIGEINQVPSWPSCQSIAFPLCCFTVNSVGFFFKKQSPKSGAASEYAWLVSFRLSVSAFLSRYSCIWAHVWMVMNNQTLLGYLDFL